jgi:protease IV
MKAFFASFVGTLLALAAFVVVSVVLLVGGLAVLATVGEQPATVAKGSYLVLNLDGVNLTDSPPLVEGGGLGRLLNGDAPQALALRRATETLRAAAKDSRIRGVFITGMFAPADYGTGFAALTELREALAAFKAAGKPVKAYFDEMGTSELYLASEAQELVLNPFGIVVMPGLASEPMFFADAFEKWGVGVQVTRSGKYKGAVEPYIRKDLSPESREQTQVLLGDLWKVVVSGIADARGISPAAVQSLVDAEGLITPESAQKAGLVTAVGYRDEILKSLHDETGADAGDPFTQVAFSDYEKLVKPKQAGLHDQGTIAVVYAEGEIVDGEGDKGEIGGSAFARELRALREDDDIVAVVLRVNSPGGSASAAEEMLRELRLLKERKHLVISMGTYAASGGYWISSYGDRIFTEAATVTGSIGVFGMQFNVQDIGAKVGVTWDRVQTGALAGVMSSARPKSPVELAVFQRLVDHTYDQFLDRVSEGRGLEKTGVHAIAQGRVWSGTRAVELGLADEIGGLDAAIAHAAKLAEIKGEPEIYEYPSTQPLGEAIKDLLHGGTHPETTLRGPLGGLARQVSAQVKTLGRFNDPRGIYARLPVELGVH